MDMNYILKDKKVDNKLLKDYGFNLINGKYVFNYVLNNDLDLVITIDDITFNINVLDHNTKDLYLPYFVKSNNGEYVVKIRTKVQEVVSDIITNCFISDNVRDKVLLYVKDKYKTIPCYPWKDTPHSCTLKKESGKWYGLIMDIPYKSLGIDNDGIIDIINIKLDSKRINELIDRKNFFPAYHMNKKYWITILLSNDLDFNRLTNLIDESYNLVK